MDRVKLKPTSKDRFTLLCDYNYKDVTVPKGYETNGADIPRVFWSITSPNSPEYLSAIVVHDYLCDREEYNKADEYLREMMSELGCSKWKVWVFYCVCKIYHKVRYGV